MRDKGWMRATRFEFRYRVAIIAAIFTIGLALFWSFPIGAATGQTTWLVLSLMVAGTHWLGLDQATLLVTVVALLAGVAGAALRVWGTAHIGTATMYSTSLVGGEVVSSGPYRHVRNPLYLGLWLITVPMALLMPVAGAVFVFAALTVFLLRIIGGEEAHLGEKLGSAYQVYRTRVRRLTPAANPAIANSGAKPRWGQAVGAEIFSVGFVVCFALLAWRYNARLLIRCEVVCFGISLIAKSLIQKSTTGGAGVDAEK